MEKGNIFPIILLFFILTGLGYLASFQKLDPDFGWHFRTGSLILEKGVPEVDWYSYPMSNFPWINHEWLTDILIYKIYSLFGFHFTLLFFIILVSLAFIILIKPSAFWDFLIPVLIGYWACLGFLGIRSQLLTIFFIAILWKILREFLDSNSRSIYLCPILFVIWVNLHGGFFVGLFLLFLILILELFKKTSFFQKLLSWRFFSQQSFQPQPFKKISILFIILILSFLATFINPYEPRIYEEIFRTIGDQFLRFHIAEWLPLFSTDSLPIFTILYTSLFWGLFILFRRKIDFTYSIILPVFFVFALLSQRHFFIFVIISIPIFARLIFYFKESIDPTALRLLLPGFKKWLVLFVILGILLIGWYPILRGVFTKTLSLVYPEKAIPFLKTLPLSENLLNEYAWGGYLIWQLPERKLFIDGRMPSWRQNGEFVFGDYVKIMEADEGFQELLEKYKIKIILLNKEKKTEAEKRQKTETKSKNTFLQEKLKPGLSQFLKEHQRFAKLLGIDSFNKNIYQELINLGWKVVYEDDTALILRKPK